MFPTFCDIINTFQADGEGGGDDDDDDNEDPIDMSFPKEPKKMIVYLISFPIMAPLFYTLPDTKNKESKLNYFPWFDCSNLDIQ